MNLARRAGVTIGMLIKALMVDKSTVNPMQIIDYKCVDIEANWKIILEEFKETADVVHVSRYLERDLMDFIK